jgi:hypothetical protein
MVAARERLRKAGFGKALPNKLPMGRNERQALEIQLCLCRKLLISSFYNLQHQMPDRCVLTALAFSMPML